MAFKVGDRVKVATREVNADDAKTQLYFEYFAGLTGSVDTMFDDGSICIKVDLESLTEAARDRHAAMQEAERRKWLDGLSGEARSRLTPEQQQLTISYKILVDKKDLEPLKGGEPSKPSASKKPSAKAEAPKEEGEPPPTRVSEQDLAAKEEEHLRSLQQDK